MDTYSLLRSFADSWMLLVLTLFFVGVVFWAWRPGSRKHHDEAANAIFRHETKPADDDPESSSEEARK
ncbi:cbb3-type cytochrome c oxidase subunit 3 [Cereibacter sphaeroides]|jgi:cytochrome c oxidase cbb3-type subunit 4|uniref:cbb3-type cytochrome c oxidase subunit 3 n=1 Tax=Rhodobacterales TaxID=204455 RepID=UPI000BBE18E5|nr:MULTISPECIES: cbb3-type cytochrome c oxidase subunit 3 [Paracoccaceae]MCE6950532.1 cbb3-type cytochrome c oxidase subunit 3 [Cereibacter sphaeroides]MCE6959435.1 cbb3-type cytochrome c oxidase subunit 3 [Cereibacter sphaeroides]MCE6968292.1 cbb3-type cytochrome c oxidase subunit 3 [Cereibacter sphaeroides]MCE6973794.1 cbb3-type cytochrome c oxidase subunit 3 [Cereibacter sphaeroides]